MKVEHKIVRKVDNSFGYVFLTIMSIFGTGIVVLWLWLSDIMGRNMVLKYFGLFGVIWILIYTCSDAIKEYKGKVVEEVEHLVRK